MSQQPKQTQHYMGPLNAISARARIAATSSKRVYVCPKDKSHAVLDLNFFSHAKDQKNASIVNVYLSDKLDPAEVTKEDALLMGLHISGFGIVPELGRVIVGGGQSIVVEVVTGPTVNVRVYGKEQAHRWVAKAGKLGGLYSTFEGVNELYRLDTPLAASMSGTLFLLNEDSATEAVISISDNDESRLGPEDEIMGLVLPKGETVYVENIGLAPGERIFINSKSTKLYAVMNGVVVSGTYVNK